MLTFPAAEAFARKMPLPLTVCAETKALYGVAVPVLDRAAAINALCAAGFYCTPGVHRDRSQHDAALAVLEARVEALAAKNA